MLREGHVVRRIQAKVEVLCGPRCQPEEAFRRTVGCGCVIRKKRTDAVGVCGDGESAQVVEWVVEWVVEGLGRRAMNQITKDGVIKTAAGRMWEKKSRDQRALPRGSPLDTASCP